MARKLTARLEIQADTERRKAESGDTPAAAKGATRCQQTGNDMAIWQHID